MLQCTLHCDTVSLSAQLVTLWVTSYYMFVCCCFLSGLFIIILPVFISLEGIAGNTFQNAGFPQPVFRLISRESLDQHITPLGDHVPIYVNFLKTGDGYAKRNKKVSYGILVDL